MIPSDDVENENGKDLTQIESNSLFAIVTAEFQEDSRKNFDELFPEGLKPSEYTDCFTRLLSWKEDDTKDALKCITFLLTEKWSNDEYDTLSVFTDKGDISETCNKNIEDGSVVFQCKTLQKHFSSIICAECYKNSKHPGHEYIMIRANGGFCDCGNIELWKREGFCCKHTGNLGENDVVDYRMTRKEKDVIETAIKVVSKNILDKCRSFGSIQDWNVHERQTGEVESAKEVNSTQVMLVWLMKFMQTGQDLRRFIGSILAFPLNNAWIASMMALEGVGKLPSKVHSAIHDLYTEIIIDVKLKQSFVDAYVINYPNFIQAIVNSRRIFQLNSSDRAENYKNDIIARFSGHIISSPACTKYIVRENGLLEMQLRTLLKVLEAASAPVLPYKNVPYGKTRYFKEKEKNQDDKMYGTEVALTHGRLPVSVREIANTNKNLNMAVMESKLRDLSEISRQGILQTNIFLAVLATNAYQPLHNLQRKNYEILSKDSIPEIEAANLEDNSILPYFYHMLQSLKNEDKKALEGTGTIAHKLRVQWFHSHLMTSVFWKIFFELRFIMSNSEASKHLIYERPDLFRLLVRILSMFQGMQMNSRLFDNHVSMESDSWAKALNIEISIADLLHFVIDAFCRDPKTEKGNTVNGREVRLRCISIVRQCLNEWIDRERRLEMLSVSGAESFTVSHGTSMHLPLHRLYSSLIHHVVRIHGITAKKHLGLASAEAHTIASHPLRLQVFFSQTQAGMWNRNGESIRNEQHYYRATECSKWMIDLDIFLLQTVVSIVGASNFIREALFFYQIKDFQIFINLDKYIESLKSGGRIQFKAHIKGATDIAIPQSDINSLISDFPRDIFSREDKQWNETSLGEAGFFGTFISNLACAKYIPHFAKDILTLFINVITERSRCGFDDYSYIRYKLIHALSWENQTHSELLQASHKRVTMPNPKDDPPTPVLDYHEVEPEINKCVDDILKDIAVFVQGQEDGEGNYRLKHKSWEEYNRFSTAFSPKKGVSAEERYFAACNSTNIEYIPFPTNSVSKRFVFPEYIDLQNLAYSLCSTDDFGLVSLIISKCLSMESDEDNKYSYLTPALYLIFLSCDYASEMIENSSVIESRASWIHDQSFRNNSPNNMNIWCLGSFGEVFTTFRHFPNVLQKQDPKPKSCIQLLTELYKRSAEKNSSFAEFKDGIALIVSKLKSFAEGDFRADLSKEMPRLIGEIKKGHESSSIADDSEEAKKKELRRKMQERALREMQESQNRFEMDLDLEDAFDSIMDDEDLKNSMTALEKSSFKEIDHFSQKTCILCQEACINGENIGMIGFAQRTKVPGLNKMFFEDEEEIGSCFVARKLENEHESEADMREMNLKIETEIESENGHEAVEKFIGLTKLCSNAHDTGGIHFNFCGHTVHSHCIEQYFGSILIRERENEPFEGHDRVIAERGEFLCPVCRRMSNIVIQISKLRVKAPLWERRMTKSFDGKELSVKEWTKNFEKDHKSITAVSGKRKELEGFLDSLKNSSSDLNSREDNIIKLGFHARNILFEYGRWVKWSDNDRRQAKTLLLPEKLSYSMKMGCQNVLINGILSTIICIETASRSGYWKNAEVSKKNLGMMMREAQNISQELSELSWYTRKILWESIVGSKTVDIPRIDPFTSFVVMVLLWDGQIKFEDIYSLLSLCFDSAVQEASFSKDHRVRSEIKWNEIVVFLRRSSVFLMSYLDIEIGLTSYSEERISMHDDIEKMMTSLLLPSSALKFKNNPETKFDVNIGRVGLVNLPEKFTDLMLSLNDRGCDDNGSDKGDSVLCLITGKYICDLRLMRRHATDYGNGIGLFLSTRSLRIFVLRDFRVSTLSSPYLDRYGEEDPELRRKRPLFLSKERYLRLQRLWLLHELDYDFRVLNATRFQNF